MEKLKVLFGLMLIVVLASCEKIDFLDSPNPNGKCKVKYEYGFDDEIEWIDFIAYNDTTKIIEKFDSIVDLPTELETKMKYVINITCIFYNSENKPIAMKTKYKALFEIKAGEGKKTVVFEEETK